MARRAPDAARRGRASGSVLRFAARDRAVPTLRPPPGIEASVLDLRGEELVVFRLPLTRSRAALELSSAEREVAELAVLGLSNPEIARRRGTTVRTVANQLASVFRKLGVGSRKALAVRWLREGS